MTVLEKILKRLPKMYHDRVKNIEEEDDLIDDCKYMVYYSENYTDGDCYGSSYPVRNISEAIDFIKNILHK